MFDTHAIARALTAAEFTPAQADALTDAVRQAAEHDAAGVDVGTLATKDDVAAVKTDVAALERTMKTDVAALERTMKADVAALERTMKANLCAEIAATELRLVKWIIGTGVAVAGLVVAGVVAALRLLG